MSDLTWPIVVSILGLLVPLLASYFQRSTERTSLRQLERVAAVETQRARLYITEDGKAVVAAKADEVLEELRALQSQLVDELKQQLQRSRDRRALAQALGYLFFVIIGLVASLFALVQASIAESNDFQTLAIVAASILVALNALGFLVALFFVIDTLGVLFPKRGPELSFAKTARWIGTKLGLRSASVRQEQRPEEDDEEALGDGSVVRAESPRAGSGPA